MAAFERGKVIELTSQTQWNELLGQSSSRLVVLNWTSPTCAPCQRWAPTFVRLASTHVQVLFVKAVVERVRFLPSPPAVPTFHFYKHRRVVDELQGADEPAFLALLAKHSPDSAVRGWEDLGSARKMGPAKDRDARAGTPLTFVPDAALLEELVALGIPEQTARRALQQTGNAGLEQAIAVAFGTEEGQLVDDPVVEDIDSSSSSSNPTSSSAIPMDPAEVERRAQELQARAKRMREEREEQEEKRKQQLEVARIASGKQAQEDKEKFNAQQAQRDIDDARREQLAEAEWRRQVLEKIARQQAQRESDRQEGLLEGVSAAPLAAPKYNASAYASCELQVRMPDGSRLRYTFPSSDTVQAVMTRIEQEHPALGMFMLQTPLPVEQFTGAKVYTTLADAGLAPRGILVLKTLEF